MPGAKEDNAGFAGVALTEQCSTRPSKSATEEIETELGSGPIDFRRTGRFTSERRSGHMSDLFWLTDAQMARLEPYFSKSHGKPSSVTVEC